MKYVTLISMLTLSAATVLGQTVKSAADGRWNDRKTWTVPGAQSPTLPNSSEQIIIQDHFIQMTRTEDVENFHLKDGGLDLGAYDLNIVGQAAWYGGEITGEGSLVNKGKLTLLQGPDKLLDAAFINEGEVDHKDLGNLKANYSAEFVNRESGVYNMDGDASITGDFYAEQFPKFLNRGTLRKTGGATTSRVSVVLNNHGGTIEVESGTLRLGGMGGQGSLHKGGTFEITREGVLDIGGNNIDVFNGVYTGSGEGRVEFRRGTMLASTDMESTRFKFENGGFYWMGGALEPKSALVINEGVFVLDGLDVKKLRSGPGFLNKGRILHIGKGSLNLEYGSSMVNDRQAEYILRNEGGIFAEGGKGEKPLFYNKGLFKRDTSDLVATIRTPFVNEGKMEMLSGVINFADAFVQNDGEFVINGGIVSASAGFDLQGGVLTGKGYLYAFLVNGGEVAPGLDGYGTLNLSGNYVQRPEGRLSVEIGGYEAGEDSDLLMVEGSVAIAGILRAEVGEGFTPRVGDTFRILKADRVIGTFASESLAPLPEGMDWKVDYQFQEVSLQVVSE